MRVTITTIAGLTSLAGLLIGNPVSAANLILNPGFETGEVTTSWLVLGASDGSAYVNVQTPNNGPSAPGTYDAYMYNVVPAANLALQQSTALGSASHGLVNYSIDLKVDSSLVGGVVFVHLWDINSTGGVIDPGPGLLGPYFNTSWTTLSGSWTAPANVDHFEIEIDCTDRRRCWQHRSHRSGQSVNQSSGGPGADNAIAGWSGIAWCPDGSSQP